MVLANIDNFINSQILKDYDIISVLEFWLSGSFALFRNCERVNTLFKKSKDWVNIFSGERHFAFDECGRLNIKEGHKIYNELLTGKSILDLDTDIEAFTHILKNEKKVISSKDLL